MLRVSRNRLVVRSTLTVRIKLQNYSHCITLMHQVLYILLVQELPILILHFCSLQEVQVLFIGLLVTSKSPNPTFSPRICSVQKFYILKNVYVCQSEKLLGKKLTSTSFFALCHFFHCKSLFHFSAVCDY